MKLVFTCHSTKYIRTIAEKRKAVWGAAELPKPFPRWPPTAEGVRRNPKAA